MTDQPTPDDYDIEDGFDEDRALEKCPHCDLIFSANGSYGGPVWDQTGSKYEHITTSDPDDGPFFCEGCWTEVRTNQKQQENAVLGDFA